MYRKSDPAENGRRSQRLLITWISDDPSLYRIVRKYISPEDFTEELYRKVAERLFDELDRDQFQPAGIISMFEDEEEQREAAELFHTTLPELSTRQERERAFHDILLAVKKQQLSILYGKAGDGCQCRQTGGRRAKKHWKNYKGPIFPWNNGI